jgi:hypothetical protein
MTEPHDHVPEELVQEINDAFNGSIAVPDSDLWMVVEAQHAFLDAIGDQETHDERLRALLALTKAISPESDQAADALREWCKQTHLALRKRMQDIGMTRTAIWVFHPTLHGFKLWTLSVEYGLVP